MKLFPVTIPTQIAGYNLLPKFKTAQGQNLTSPSLSDFSAGIIIESPGGTQVNVSFSVQDGITITT